MPPISKVAQTTQMYADIEVIKMQTLDILKTLNGNGHPGLVQRVGCVETDVRALKQGRESEEKKKETIETRTFELSKSLKVVIVTGLVALTSNIILMAVNLIINLK